MDKPAQNIQDSFLNAARKERVPVTIYLLSGVKLTGRIRSFDKYCVMLESGNQEQMIFKHAISTIVLQRSGLREQGERAAHAGGPVPVASHDSHPLGAEAEPAAVSRPGVRSQDLS